MLRSRSGMRAATTTTTATTATTATTGMRAATTAATTAALVLALAVLLSGCANDRSAGAGELTVTSKTKAAPPHRTTASHTRAARAADVHSSAVHFARVPLTGTDHTLTVPRGWRAALWAHVTGARFEAWSPQGALLVSSPDAGTVTELSPLAEDHAPVRSTVAQGLLNPQGLAFDRIGRREYLYVADSNALLRYRWTTAGRAIDGTTLIPDLPDTLPAGDDEHRYKDVAVAADHTIYVDIGSSSNATIPTAPPKGTLPRASVIAFHPNGTLERVWATGVRNGDGLAFAPDGSLWTAVNERDQIPYPFHRDYDSGSDAYGEVIADYVDNHPPDEIARLTPGRNLGWPYCDPDPDEQPGAAATGLHYGGLSFTPDEATDPQNRRLDCARLAPLQRGLPAHSAPLGLTFLAHSELPRRWADGAVVAAHGSWDRQPPRAPVVYWMPWEARRHTLGRAVILVSGFQYPNGSRWGRVADAVPGPDGSLYVTDDQSGAVYRITP